MKIELKNLKIYDKMSEETLAFTADVYVNGKKVAYAKNDGCGGCTNYNAYSQADRALLVEAEGYCNALPSTKHEFGGKTVELPQSLESVIDAWVYRVDEEKHNAKQKKKVQSNMQKGLVYETPKGLEVITWKGHTIASLLVSPEGRMALTNKILQLTQSGYKVLNTNLPEVLTKIIN